MGGLGKTSEALSASSQQPVHRARPSYSLPAADVIACHAARAFLQLQQQLRAEPCICFLEHNSVRMRAHPFRLEPRLPFPLK